MKHLRNAFTIRRRLILFGLLAALFALGCARNSLAALESSRAATAQATDIADMQRSHQDAVSQLSSMRSIVLEAMIVGDTPTTARLHELETELQALANAADDSHTVVAELDSEGVLSETLPAVIDAQHRFVNDAFQMGSLAINDPEAAVADLDRFLDEAAPLFEDLEQISGLTAVLSNQATTDATDASEQARRSILAAAATSAALIIVATIAVAYSITRQLRQLSGITRSLAAGNLHVRNEINSAGELGGLARSLDEMADSFEHLVMRLEEEASQDAFRRQLFDAFDMTSGDSDVHVLVEEAMFLIGDRPMEMLLSDPDSRQFTQAAIHPQAAAPTCPVKSSDECVAVRRGHRLVFESSGTIDACPHLKRRGSACSAVCVPVTFNGESLGVIHATGEDGVPVDDHTVDRLTALATQTGARLGTINAFRGAREQAAIDGLTGLRNRRTVEQEVGSMVATDTDFALIMCDLDRFKSLNDYFGHEMGDKALRLFGKILNETTREHDIAARLGGEEFVIVQPGMTASEAVATVERIQLALSTQLELGDTAQFTASFGISDTTVATGLDAILRIADAALLAAKNRGRDQWIIGNPLMASELAQRGRSAEPDTGSLERDQATIVLHDRV